MTMNNNGDNVMDVDDGDTMDDAVDDNDAIGCYGGLGIISWNVRRVNEDL